MSTYENENMPLTSGVARQLVPKLFAGEGYKKRSEIIESVSKYHVRNGGEPMDAKKTVSNVKKAMNDLKKVGRAERHPDSTGYWRIR